MNLLIIWIMLLSSRVYAGEWSELSGQVELRSGYFLSESSGFSEEMGQAFLSAQSSGSYDNFEVRIAPVYTHSAQNLEQPTESDGHFLSSELTGEFTSRNIDILAGFSSINWGAGDGFNPTNGFSSFDLADPIFPRKISQGLVALKLHPSEGQDFVFEFIVVPEGQVDRLPLSERNGIVEPRDSRWGVILPTAVEFGETLTLPLAYQLRSENNNSKTDFAARLRLLQVRGWDYSLSFGQFRRKRAVLSFELTGDASDPNLPLTLIVKPYYARRNMIGFNAAGIIGEFGVRFEAAKYLVLDSDREFGYDSFIGNFGVDRIWDDVFKNYSIYLNLAYIQINNSKSASFDNNSIDLAVAESYATMKLELQSEKWTHGFDYLMTVSQNLVLNLSSSYNWTDALEFAITANFLSGRGSSGIGALNGNHRLIGSLKYIF